MADLFQDLVHACGPDEWFWLLVVVGQVFVDGLLQFGHTVETAAPNTLIRDLAKPALY